MPRNRNYSCKDVDMLMASKIIAGNFKANIAELSTIRTNWTENYADGLTVRINNAMEAHLGTDTKSELRDATTRLETMQAMAKSDLSFFKTQVNEDFKYDPQKREDILKRLGFTSYFKDAQKGDQESLIQLLYIFKRNITGKLEKEVTEKGMNPALIKRITNYADAIKEANITQETLKGTTKLISGKTAETFSAVYDEIIGICKIATNYYKHDPLKKALFTFGKVISNMNAIRKAPPQGSLSGMEGSMLWE